MANTRKDARSNDAAPGPASSETSARAVAHGTPGRVHTHVMPVSVLLSIFGLLVFLTAATVAVTWVDLGPLNIWVALLIAVAKAALVALYFMHLRYDHPFFGQILITSLFFVGLFIGITLLDTTTYQGDLKRAEPPEVSAGASSGSP